MDIRGSLYLAGASQDGQGSAPAPVQMHVTRFDFPISFAGTNQTSQTKQIQITIQLPSRKKGCDEVQGIELQLDLPVIGNILRNQEGEKLVVRDHTGLADDDCICQHDLPFSTVSAVKDGTAVVSDCPVVVSTRRDFCCEWAPTAALHMLYSVENVTAEYTVNADMLRIFNNSCNSGRCTRAIRLPLSRPGDVLRLRFTCTVGSKSILRSSNLGGNVFTDGKTSLHTEFLSENPTINGKLTCRYTTSWDPQAKPNARQRFVALQQDKSQHNLFRLSSLLRGAVVRRFMFSERSAGAVLVLNGKPVTLDFNQPLCLCIGRLHSVAVLTQTADPDQRIYAVVDVGDVD